MNGYLLAGLAALALVLGIAAGMTIAHLEWWLADRVRRRRRARVKVFDPAVLLRSRLDEIRSRS